MPRSRSIRIDIPVKGGLTGNYRSADNLGSNSNKNTILEREGKEKKKTIFMHYYKYFFKLNFVSFLCLFSTIPVLALKTENVLSKQMM